MCEKFGPYVTTSFCILENLRNTWYPYVLLPLVLILIAAGSTIRQCCCRQTRLCCNHEPKTNYDKITYVFLPFAWGLLLTDSLFLIWLPNNLMAQLVKIAASVAFLIIVLFYRAVINPCDKKLAGNKLALFAIPMQLLEMGYFVAQQVIAIIVADENQVKDAMYPYLSFEIGFVWMYFFLITSTRVMWKMGKRMSKLDDDLQLPENQMEEIAQKINTLRVSRTEMVEGVVELGYTGFAK